MNTNATVTFTCQDTANFKLRMINWMKGFSKSALLDGNRSTLPATMHWEPYDWVAGIGAVAAYTSETLFLEGFQQALESDSSWWFGFLSYDLKNSIEKLESKNRDPIRFPIGYFFIPELLVYCRSDEITLVLHEKSPAFPNVRQCYQAICSMPAHTLLHPEPITFTSNMGKEEYTRRFNKIQHHIHRGDIYEMNFCMEFSAPRLQVDPVTLFQLLNQEAASPFACLMRLNNRYILSASPERFLRKEGNRLVSQPMKGTAPRSSDASEDKRLQIELLKNEKEQAENIMIVDLVRNDLSAFAERGSVRVDELCGLYSFPRVHQLVSTVSCKVPEKIFFKDIIRRTFPMGSMTGAPKIRAMQFIEQSEETKRGAFSGTAGYISPSGDFDFNVIIRSFLYDTSTGYLSISAGSAITAQSSAEKEYEECLLKAGYAIRAIGGILKVSME